MKKINLYACSGKNARMPLSVLNIRTERSEGFDKTDRIVAEFVDDSEGGRTFELHLETPNCCDLNWAADVFGGLRAQREQGVF